MKKFKHGITLLPGIALFLFFNGCGGHQHSSLPSSSGNSGEILIVTDYSMWNDRPGNALRDALAGEHPALPQPEPLFDLVHADPAGFTNLLKRHCNIIAAGIKTGKTDWSVREDVWASDQLVVRIVAPDISSLHRQINQHSDSMIWLFHKKDIERIQAEYRRHADKKIGSALKEKFGISLCVPTMYKIAEKAEYFIWMRCETEETSQGIVVYQTTLPANWRDTGHPASRDIITALRDSVMKRHVSGPLQGTYMTTEHNFPLVINEVVIGGVRAFEARGLWRVEGDFMGGPFIGISVPDKRRHRLLTAEGFVYAPKYDKRNYLRQVEAIVASLAIISK